MRNVKPDSSTYIRHLATHPENKVQEDCYVKKALDHIKALKVNHAVCFKPGDKKSAIDFIRIGFHEQSQLSVLAMAKPGLGKN